MKKLLSALLASLMLLVPVLTYAETAVDAGTAQVELTTEQKLERMLPVLDSFARNMGIEGEIARSSSGRSCT